MRRLEYLGSNERARVPEEARIPGIEMMEYVGGESSSNTKGSPCEGLEMTKTADASGKLFRLSFSLSPFFRSSHGDEYGVPRMHGMRMEYIECTWVEMITRVPWGSVGEVKARIFGEGPCLCCTAGA